MFTARLLVFLSVIGLLLAVQAATHTAFNADRSHSHWKNKGPPPSDSSFQFRVDLMQQNLDALEQLFFQISDPNHIKFRKYMTSQEISELISPSEEIIQRVGLWIGCDSFQPFHATPSTSVGKIECRLSINRDL
jgi:hypothetical protein